MLSFVLNQVNLLEMSPIFYRLLMYATQFSVLKKGSVQHILYFLFLETLKCFTIHYDLSG